MQILNKMYSIQVPMVLVGNKCDLQQSSIEIDCEILESALSLGIPFIVCNTETGENVDEAFYVNSY